MRKMPFLQSPLKLNHYSAPKGHFTGDFAKLDLRQLMPKRSVSREGFGYKFIYICGIDPARLAATALILRGNHRYSASQDLLHFCIGGEYGTPIVVAATVTNANRPDD